MPWPDSRIYYALFYLVSTIYIFKDCATIYSVWCVSTVCLACSIVAVVVGLRLLFHFVHNRWLVRLRAFKTAHYCCFDSLTIAFDRFCFRFSIQSLENMAHWISFVYRLFWVVRVRVRVRVRDFSRFCHKECVRVCWVYIPVDRVQYISFGFGRLIQIC